MEYNEKIVYERAKRRVKALRGFYFNLTSYCIVIPSLAIANLIFMPEYLWFFFSMVGWGTGLLVHAMTTFNFLPFAGKNWEEKKLKELMEKEKNKINSNNGKYI